MQFGSDVRLGDRVCVLGRYEVEVIVTLDAGEFPHPDTLDNWRFLKSGVMLQTDFAGLLHIANQSLFDLQHIKLVSRVSEAPQG